MKVCIDSDNMVDTDALLLLGRGGEAEVYAVPRCEKYPHHCIKIYRQAYRTSEREAKLQYLIATTHHLEDTPSHFRLCYPLALVVDGESGVFVGFLMQQALLGSKTLLELNDVTLFQHLPFSWQKKFPIDKQRPNRKKVIIHLANALHTLYKNTNCVVVDSKPENILLTLEGAISIIDLDSIQLTDKQGNTYMATVATENYMPPEGAAWAKDTLKHQHWDYFSIAIVFYEILHGIHPYIATFQAPYQRHTSIKSKIENKLFVHGKKSKYVKVLPSLHLLYYDLPISIQQLFVYALDGTALQRPNCEQWGLSLFDSLTTTATDSLYYPSGCIYYKGEMDTQGKPHGNGTTYFENGKAWYAGEWKDGKQHGWGIAYNKNTCIAYKGEWKNGKYDGYGEKFIAKKVLYKGDFQAGKCHGYGILYDKEGNVLQQGIFYNGKKQLAPISTISIKKHTITTKNVPTPSVTEYSVWQEIRDFIGNLFS